MVVIVPFALPATLNAYSSIPLTADIRSNVERDFNIGSYAQFGNPMTAIAFHDRADLHDKTHLQIRELLDGENMLDGFVLIDSNTVASKAIWWIESTEQCILDTKIAIEGGYPPVAHPGEKLTLWQSRMLTQDLPIAWVNLDIANFDIADVIAETTPYDPHDPQNPPHKLGNDFSTREGAYGFYGPKEVIATYEEIEYSNDPEKLAKFSPRPPGVVQLTAAAARGAGLEQQWARYDSQEAPVPGDKIELAAPIDWDSPKWPASGEKYIASNYSVTSEDA